MRVAVIGSRSAPANAPMLILKELPANVSEIVSGGATGIDSAAEEVAHSLSLPLRVFLPDYAQYGKQAPLMRNLQIVAYADEILAFWDGRSKGTQHTIAACIQQGKPVRIIPLPTQEAE